MLDTIIGSKKTFDNINHFILWEKLKEFIRDQVREDVQHARAHFEFLASKSSKYIEKNPDLVIPKIINFDADMDKLLKSISR